MKMLARIFALMTAMMLVACGGGGGSAGTPALGGSAQALFTSAPANVSVDVGRAAEFTVAGGKAPYAVSSSDLSIVSTGLQGTTSFLISGVKGGVATVTVKDSLGAAVSISVTVGPGTALFTTAPSQVTIAVGAAESFTIGGGSGPFSVSSANGTIATVQLSASGSSFTVSGQRSGTTSVVVTDAKGATVAIGLTVGSGQGSVPLFTSAASPLVIGVGTTPVYTIGGGTGPYQVTSSNESVAKATVVGTSVGISGLAAGTASIQVTDAVGGRVNIAVTVGTADVVALYTTAPPGLSLVRGNSQSFAIGGGVGPYTASSGNAAVVSATVAGSTLSMAGLGVGVTTVAVFDSQGRSTPIAVTVAPAAPLSTTAPLSLTLPPGTTGSYQIAGGVAPYQVLSSNSSVATATLNGSAFTLGASVTGAAQVTVRDSVGSQLQISLTVVAAQPLGVNVPNQLSIAIGSTRTVAIAGGVGPYTAGSSNEAVLTTSLTGQILTLTPLTSGNALVSIRDAAGSITTLNVSVGVAINLFTSAPAALAVAPGTSYTFTVAGGTAPYFVGTSAPATVSATVVGSILTITGLAPGNGNVSVRDSLGASVGVTVSVGSQSPLFTSAPSTVVMSAGTGRTFVVGGGAPEFVGGTPAYTATSSDTSIVNVTASGASLVVNAVASGSATVTIRDAVGSLTSFLVNVGGSTALYTTAPSAISLSPGIGAAQTYEIRGGAAPYVVTSGAVNVATATQSSTFNTFTVTGVAAGSTTVVVTDRLGATVNVGVTVAPASAVPLTVSPLAASGNVGDVLSFEIRGGAPVYTATVNNPRVAAAAPFGAATAFTVTLNASGSTNISVIDANGQVQNVSVTASAGGTTPLFTSAPPTVTLAVGAPRTYEVGGGSGIYKFESSNPAVAAVVSVSSTSYTVTPLAPGVASIQVSDSAGSRFSFDVNVGQVQPLVLSSGPALTLSPTAGPTSYEIIGGRAPYRAVSSNAAVLSVVSPVIGSSLSVTPAAAGTANLVVTDAAGSQVTVGVTVVAYGPAAMQVSPSTAGASVGDQLALVVKGGTPPYAFSVSNPAVAVLSNQVAASAGTAPALFSINQSASTIQTFDANGNVVSVPGVVAITVTDAGGQVQTSSVTVTQASTVLRMSPSSVLLSERASLGALDTAAATSNLKLYVYGGTGPYVAYSTDTSRAQVSVLGDVVYVFRGTSGNLCGTGVYLATVPVSSTPVNAFDLAVTVVDAKGASAVSKITVIDEAVCP